MTNINPSTYGQNIPLIINQDINTNPPIDNSLNGFTHFLDGIEYPFSQRQNNFRQQIQNPVLGLNMYNATSGIYNSLIYADLADQSTLPAINNINSTYSKRITPAYDSAFTFTSKVGTSTNNYSYSQISTDQIPTNTDLYTIQNYFDLQLTPTYSRFIYNSICNDWFFENNRDTDYKLYNVIIPNNNITNFPYKSNFLLKDDVPIWKTMGSVEQRYIQDGEFLYYDKKRNIHSSTQKSIFFQKYETNEQNFITSFPSLNYYDGYINNIIPYYKYELLDVFKFRYLNTLMNKLMYYTNENPKIQSDFTHILDNTLNIPKLQTNDIYSVNPMLNTDYSLNDNYNKINIHANAKIDMISTSEHDFLYSKDRTTIKLDNDMPVSIRKIENPFNAMNNLYDNYFDQYFGFPMNSNTTHSDGSVIYKGMTDIFNNLLNKTLDNPVYIRLCTKIRKSPTDITKNIVDLIIISQRIITTSTNSLIRDIPLKTYTLFGDNDAIISNYKNVFEILYQDNNIFLFLYLENDLLKLGYCQYNITSSNRFGELNLTDTSSTIITTVFYDMNFSIPLNSYVGFDMNYKFKNKTTNQIEDNINNFDNYEERILMFYLYDKSNIYPFELDIYNNQEYENMPTYVNLIRIDPKPFIINESYYGTYMKSIQLYDGNETYSARIFNNNTSLNVYLYKNFTYINTNVINFYDSLNNKNNTQSLQINTSTFDIINIFAMPYKVFNENSIKELYYQTISNNVSSPEYIDQDINLIIINDFGSMKYAFKLIKNEINNIEIKLSEADLTDAEINSSFYNINSLITINSSGLVSGTDGPSNYIANYINNAYSSQLDYLKENFNAIKNAYAYTTKKQLSYIENNKLYVLNYNNDNKYFFFNDIFNETYYNVTYYYEILSDTVIYSVVNDTGFNIKNRNNLTDPFDVDNVDSVNIFNNNMLDINNNSYYTTNNGKILNLCIGNNDMIYVSSNYDVTYLSKSKYSTEASFNLINYQTTTYINIFYIINVYVIWNDKHLFLFKPVSSSTKTSEDLVNFANNIIHILPGENEVFKKIDLYTNNQLLIITNNSSGEIFIYTYPLVVTEIPEDFTINLKRLDYKLMLYGLQTSLSDHNIIDLKSKYLLAQYDTNLYIYNLTLNTYDYIKIISPFSNFTYLSMLISDNYLVLIFKAASNNIQFLFINTNILNKTLDYDINQITITPKILNVTSDFNMEQYYLNNQYNITLEFQDRSTGIVNNLILNDDIKKMVLIYNFITEAEINSYLPSFYIMNDLFLMFIFGSEGTKLYYANNIFNDKFTIFNLEFQNILDHYISYGQLDNDLSMGFIDGVKNTHIYKIMKNDLDIVLGSNIYAKNIYGNEVIINGTRINDYITDMNTGLISYQTEINNTIDLQNLYIEEQSKQLKFISQKSTNPNILYAGSANFELSTPNGLYNYFLAQELGYYNGYTVRELTVDNGSNSITVYNGKDFKSIMCMFIDPNIPSNTNKYGNNPGNHSNSLLINPITNIGINIPITIDNYWNNKSQFIDNDYHFSMLPYINDGAGGYFNLTNLLYINPNTDIAIGPYNKNDAEIFADDRNSSGAIVPKAYKGLLLFHQTAYHRDRFDDMKNKIQTYKGFFNFPKVGEESSNFLYDKENDPLSLLDKIVFVTMDKILTAPLTYNDINSYNHRKDVTLKDIIGLQWHNNFDYLKVINQYLNTTSSPSFVDIYFKINENDLHTTSLRTILSNELTHFNIYYLNLIDQSLNTSSIPTFNGINYNDITMKKINDTQRINVLSENEFNKAQILSNNFGNPLLLDFQFVLTEYAKLELNVEEIPNKTIIINLFDNHEWIYNLETNLWIETGITLYNSTDKLINQDIIENIAYAIPDSDSNDGYYYINNSNVDNDEITLFPIDVESNGSNTYYIKKHIYKYSNTNYKSFTFINNGTTSRNLQIYFDGNRYQFDELGSVGGGLETSTDRMWLYYYQENFSVLVYENILYKCYMNGSTIDYSEEIYVPPETTLIMEGKNQNIWQFGKYILINLSNNQGYSVINLDNYTNKIYQGVQINYINPKTGQPKFNDLRLLYYTNDYWIYKENNTIKTYNIENQISYINNIDYKKKYTYKKKLDYRLSYNGEVFVNYENDDFVVIYINFLLNQYQSNIIEIKDIAITYDNNCILLTFNSDGEKELILYTLSTNIFKKINLYNYDMTNINNVGYNLSMNLNYCNSNYIILNSSALYPYINNFSDSTDNTSTLFNVGLELKNLPLTNNKTFISYPNYKIRTIEYNIQEISNIYSNFYKKINNIECFQYNIIINSTVGKKIILNVTDSLINMFYFNNTYYFLTSTSIYQLIYYNENYNTSLILNEYDSESMTEKYTFDNVGYIIKYIINNNITEKQYEIYDGDFKYSFTKNQEILDNNIILSYGTNDSFYFILENKYGGPLKLNKYDKKQIYPQINLNETSITNFSIFNDNLLIESNSETIHYKFKYIIENINFAGQLTLIENFTNMNTLTSYNIGSIFGNNLLKIVNINNWNNYEQLAIDNIAYIELINNQYIVYYDFVFIEENESYDISFKYIFLNIEEIIKYANIAAADPIQNQDLVTLNYFKKNISGNGYKINVTSILDELEPNQPVDDLFMFVELPLINNFDPVTEVLKVTCTMLTNENENLIINLIPQSYEYDEPNNQIRYKLGIQTIPGILNNNNEIYPMKWKKNFSFILTSNTIELT